LGFGAKVILKGDLLGRMRETLIGEPNPMRPAPRFSRIPPIMLKQERLDPLAGFADVEGRRLPGTDEVANGLVNLVRNPDRFEFTGPRQSRQQQRVPRVVLHPIARLLRDA
jgi:hypothetical protein